VQEVDRIGAGRKVIGARWEVGKNTGSGIQIDGLWRFAVLFFKCQLMLFSGWQLLLEGQGEKSVNLPSKHLLSHLPIVQSRFRVDIWNPSILHNLSLASGLGGLPTSCHQMLERERRSHRKNQVHWSPEPRDFERRQG